MEKMKHTPGEWKINEHSEIECEGYILGKVYCGDTFPSGNPELDANGQLIAAAPELLEALKAIEAEIGHTGNAKDLPLSVLDQMSNAIAKAEGLRQ